MVMKDGKIQLKVLVEKKRNRVLFAEADKDFVDILCSFLLLPMGTIVRLLSNNSERESVKVGSLSSLYEGVANLDKDHFRNDACKAMLLSPRSSREDLCKNLKINIDDTEPTKYYMAHGGSCSTGCYNFVSTYKNTRCSCGKIMNIEINNIDVKTSASGCRDSVFVEETASFIVTDDLYVMSNSISASASLLKNLGITDMNLLEERTLNVGLEEILNLLKLSLQSKNTLTDLVWPRTSLQNVVNLATDYLHPKVGNKASISSKKMTVKLFIQKSKKKTVYAEVKEDFVDFLFSFLTIQFGCVRNLLDSSPSLGNLDNLYKSIPNLNVGRCLKSPDIKGMLQYPKLATNSQCENQIFPIYEVNSPFLYLASYSYCEKYYLTGTSNGNSNSVILLGPKNPNSKGTGTGGFVKGPAMYLVTDDLVVTPLSSISGLYTLNKLKVSLNDVEEHVVTIDMEEALNILRASLNSTSALTDGLSLKVKIPKQEP